MSDKVNIANRSRTKSFPFIPIAFIFVALYWIYLILICQMTIVYDANSYQTMGLGMYKKGLVEYFKRGPTREPFYSFIVSISMRLADRLQINYQTIQRIIQCLILLATQILTLRLLKKLKVGNFLIAGAVLYIGFSPALVNAGFSLFSEIAIFPFVAAIPLVAAQAWQSLPCRSWKTIVLQGVLLSILFIFCLLVKAAFIYILPFFLLPYMLLVLYSAAKKYGSPRGGIPTETPSIPLLKKGVFRRRDKKLFVNSLLFVITVLLTTNLFVHGLKSLNKKYNGRYKYTTRGAINFYGTTVMRLDKISPKTYLTSFFNLSTYNVSEIMRPIGDNKYKELVEKGVSVQDIDPTLMTLTKKKILQKPLRFLSFLPIEGLRMLTFWEGTHVGFVIYPRWLTKLYDTKAFEYSLSIVMGSLTLISFIFAIVFLARRWRDFLPTTNTPNERLTVLFFTAFLIFSFIAPHTLFRTLQRYMLPIASLYIVLIAFSIQQMLPKKNSQIG